MRILSFSSLKDMDDESTAHPAFPVRDLMSSVTSVPQSRTSVTVVVALKAIS